MNKLFQMKFGSHLYGTDTPDSDTDYKSIYIPSSQDILLQRIKKTIQIKRNKEEKERNNKDDIDIEIFSLDRYLELLCEGQTVALDMLFAPEEFIEYTNLHTKDLWNIIKDNKHEFISKKVASFIGYSRTQAAKYGIKGSRMEALKQTINLLNQFHLHTKIGDYEEKIHEFVNGNKNIVSLEKEPIIQIVQLLAADKKTLVPHLQVCNRKLSFGCTVKFALEVLNKIYTEYGDRATKAHLADGIDWKACSHSVRVSYQGIELLKTGHITFPRPEKDLLINIKTGKLPKEEVFQIIEQGLVDLVEAQKMSKLQDNPNLNVKDLIIENIYKIVVKET